jgi:hypothetical protein
VAGCSSCKDKQPAKQVPPSAITEGRSSSITPRPSLELAEVTGAGVVPVTKLGAKIVVSKDAILLEGERVVEIAEDGVVDRSRLETLTHRLETKASDDAPLAVTLDATLPVRRVSIILDALGKAGFRNLALLTGTGTTMIPIELMDSSEVNTGSGLRPVVTLGKNYVSVWSVSGEEGTRAKPKLAYDLKGPPDFAPVTRALADVVQTHWPSGKRSAQELNILLQVDGDRSAQDLLQLAAAVRTDGAQVLFPGIFLAGR